MHDGNGNNLNDPQGVMLGGLTRPLGISALVMGIAGLTGGVALGLQRDDGWTYFSYSYLLNYCFFLSITLGALFSVALDHVTRSGWNVVLRRLAEIMAANMPCLVVLIVPLIAPLLWGYHGLFAWNDAAAVAHDPAVEHKAAYLNSSFFVVRAVIYLAVWWRLGRFFLARSLEQDRTGNAMLTLRMERMSPAALLLCAGTATFASFDWLMSLSPHWFSTIFGVYFYSGAVVAFVAAMILATSALQAAGRLRSAITTEHYHDLGKLLFAFVVFWGYIAFSQYLLMWYANIPEETEWYLERQTGPWVWVSVALLFGNLLIPFCGLLSRYMKRRVGLLAFWAVWLLLMHWIDLYWLIMPNYTARATSPTSSLPFGAIDVCLFLGLGGVYLAGLLDTAGRHALLPLADPRLDESLHFENT
jgi:hypothetical protein